MINVSPVNQSTLDSKYGLVVAVAKRAREILARREPGLVLAHKPVTIALEEIEQGRVRVITRADGKPVEGAGEAEAAETPEVPKPEVEKPEVQ